MNIVDKFRSLFAKDFPDKVLSCWILFEINDGIRPKYSFFTKNPEYKRLIDHLVSEKILSVSKDDVISFSETFKEFMKTEAWEDSNV